MWYAVRDMDLIYKCLGIWKTEFYLPYRQQYLSVRCTNSSLLLNTANADCLVVVASGCKRKRSASHHEVFDSTSTSSKGFSIRNFSQFQLSVRISARSVVMCSPILHGDWNYQNVATPLRNPSENTISKPKKITDLKSACSRSIRRHLTSRIIVP